MYQMPPLEKGDTVVWYPDADPNQVNAEPAVCVQVEGDTAILNIMRAGCRNFVPRDCVRHISDPWLESHPNHKSEHGAWDYSPLMKRVMELEVAFTKPKGK